MYDQQTTHHALDGADQTQPELIQPEAVAEDESPQPAPGVAAPALPPGATKADLERWLKELNAVELAEKRRKQAAQRAAARAKRREQVRIKRSKAVELLYAYYGVKPVEGDETEERRIADLLGRLNLDQRPVAKPGWPMVDPVKLDLHVATTKEADVLPDRE